MDDLRAILDQLEDAELDYVFERSRVTSDKAAYEAAGVAKSTFYGWDADRRDQLNDYAQQLKRRAKMRAQLVLEDKAEEAAQRLVALLDSKNENVQLRAAQDVLDRTTGKPRQAVDVTSGGETIKHYAGWMPDEWDDDDSSDLSGQEPDGDEGED